MNINDVLRLLDVVSKTPNGFLARCPAHDDKNASMHVSEGDKGIVLKCNTGCTFADVCAALKIEEKDLFYVKEENTRRPSPATPIGPLLKYPIKTVDGHTVAIRTKQRLSDGKKDLRWEQPDGRPGLGGAKTAELPLYGSERIPEFLASRWIEICEGEGAAAALNEMGANALGTSTGAGSCPTPGVLNSLLGFRVRLWPDNDAAGAKHMQRLSEILRGLDIQHVTLDTSTLPAKGDAVEWIDRILKAGTEKIRLVRILQDEDRKDLPGLPLLVPGQPTAAEKEETEKNPEKAAARAADKNLKQEKKDAALTIDKAEKNSRKPAIVISGKQMSDLITESWNAVIKANDPPSCFRRSGKLVYVVSEHGASPVVENLGESGFRGILARSAGWFRENEEGISHCFPPREISQDGLVFIDQRLPVLKSVVSCPVFAPDGSLCSTDGYHWNAQTLVTMGEKIEVSPTPTKEGASAAARFILEELIGDFAFATASDRAHALGAFLTPLCRNLIAGPTPLHDFSSPVQGSGKGLLVQTIAVVVLGKQVAGQRLPSDEEEIGKTLLSELSTAKPIILLDNTDATGRRAIDSASLEGVLTAEEWTGRQLGKIGMLPPLPNRALWCMTGVNLEFAKGLKRRRARVRIDPHSEEPWKRPSSEFKRPGDQLLSYAKEKRSEILSHLFSMALYFLSLRQEDRPAVKSLGSFEAWSKLIGGIVTAAGVTGWLGFQDDPEECAVESGMDDWPEFITAWYKEFQEYPQPVSKLNELADRNGLLFSIRGDKGKRSEETKLGIELKKMRARVISGLRINPESNPHSKSMNYRLQASTPTFAHPTTPNQDLAGPPDPCQQVPQGAEVPHIVYPHQLPGEDLPF